MENGEQLWFNHLNHGFNYEQMIKHGALTNEIVDFTNTHAENTGFTVTIQHVEKLMILTINIWIWLSTITAWWLRSLIFVGGFGDHYPRHIRHKKNATTNQHMFFGIQIPICSAMIFVYRRWVLCIYLFNQIQCFILLDQWT